MAGYKRIALEIKNEILKKIKDGQTAKDLAPSMVLVLKVSTTG